MKSYPFWTFIFGIIILLSSFMEIQYVENANYLFHIIIATLGFLLIGSSLIMIKRGKWIYYSTLCITIVLLGMFGYLFYSQKTYFPALLAILSGISSFMYLLKILKVTEIE